MDAANPILHYALGLTIEIYKEMCDSPRISLGRVGKLAVEAVVGKSGVAGREGWKCKPYIILCITDPP